MNFFEHLGNDGPLDEDNELRREQRREREFYRYYEPICSLSPVVPSHVNPFDALAAARHVPRSSPDRALTAFCQLGALRLQARRCLLFFFDTEYAYILAESTRTLSLVDDNVHEDEDALWLGNAVIPRGISVCEHTVNIPEANFGSNRTFANAGIVHIINNLQEDTRFCDRPFVVGGPRARFYAGVPITTPNGYRIGAFCILDDKPREGISDKDVEFLEQMSRTVMDHIETVRERAEFQRGSQMLTSMESFFSSAPAVLATSRKTSLLPEVAMQRKTVIAQAEDGSVLPSYFDTTNGKPDEQSTSAGSAEVQASPSSSNTKIHETKIKVEPPAKVSPAAGDELDAALEHNIKTTFETAATLIRSAAGIDGMSFLKVEGKSGETRDGVARLVEGTESDIDSVRSDTEHPSTDAVPTTDSDRDEKLTIRSKTCPVLGSSIQTMHAQSLPRVDMIPARLLRSLLRRYPLGKVWYFDAAGETSLGDSSEEPAPTSKRSSNASSRDSGSQASSLQHRKSRAKESKEIEQLFPGVRALGLVGMYDLSKNRVYAAGITWTYSPVRILTVESDLGFLRAFSDVIMSSVARLQAKMEDQAKSDFISSISHELRSPLHGILGSVDFLQESESADQTIVTQIERCSITLMDVIEHLLEFAKINNLRQSPVRGKRGTRVQAWLDSSTHMSDRVQSLAKLTEEVADATFYSHCCNLEAKDHGNVAFILDIAARSLEDYKVPVGAWKRLCINIINNALKYTREGHISVSLKPSRKVKRSPVAVLTVTDTGKGMSREFLEHHLFKAFSQEDSLSNGTGLGMSLVAKLVRNMNGKIEVQSTKDVGTTIKVSLPVELRDGAPEQALPAKGTRVRLPPTASASNDIQRNDRTLQHTALERVCKVLGAETVEEDADITLLLESDLAAAFANESLKRSVASKAVIVLCTSFASAATLRHSALARALNCFIDFVPQPYGPARMLESIKRCQLAISARSSTSMGDLTQRISTLEANSDHDATPKSMEEATEYITALREDAARVHESRHSVQRNFFDLHKPPKQGDQVAGAATPSVTSPASVQSIIDTPSTLDPSTPGHEKPAPTNDKQLSLLIVDDNRINVRILMTYADRHGHPRITASNGLEAVEAYSAAALPKQAGIDELHATVPKPNVIFMDINMPICDGFEASKRIRAFEKANNISPATIIALTGLGSAEAHQQARAVGIDVFLTKPLRPKELKPLLESISQGMKESE